MFVEDPLVHPGVFRPGLRGWSLKRLGCSQGAAAPGVKVLGETRCSKVPVASVVAFWWELVLCFKLETSFINIFHPAALRGLTFKLGLVVVHVVFDASPSGRGRW